MLKYFSEIKNRFFLLSITYLTVILTVYFYKEIIIFLIIQSKSKFDLNNLDYFIFTDVTEIFSVYIKLILFSSTQIITVFFLYHLILFFIPALFKKEYFFIKFFFKLFFLVWIISSLIAIKILIPLSWNFFLSFQELIVQTTSLNIYFEAKIIEYFYFYIYFYYLTFIYFQMGTLLIIIFNYFHVNLQIIKKFRKVYYFILILTSTFLCFDINSQLFFSFLSILSYEIFIFIFCLNKNFF